MKIAQIAPVEEVVPPRKYGGTELVVHNLTEELIKRGHQVDLFASGDSHTSGGLIPLVPQAIRTVTQTIGQEKVREAWKYIAQANLLERINKEKYDIVHQHVGWRVSPIEKMIKAPVVMTCHAPLSYDYAKLVYGLYKNNNYVTISNAQRRALPELNFIDTVYNGIDLRDFDYGDGQHNNYFAFLGRMSPEKGPKQAILAAKKAGVKLKMAAKIDAVDQKYFKTEIEPLIDGKQIEFIGEIDPVKRNKFLSNALGLLGIIQWEEPFGLYFIESMATGTPVIATKRGSAPEIIVNSQTGFLVSIQDDVQEAANAIKKIVSLNKKDYAQMRANCRKRVEDYFTVEKMVSGYEKVYKKLINKI